VSRESSLHLVSRVSGASKKMDSPRWRAIFQILTVIGMILVLVSLLLLLQGLGAGDAPPAFFGA
jgi:hypothetical protein